MNEPVRLGEGVVAAPAIDVRVRVAVLCAEDERTLVFLAAASPAVDPRAAVFFVATFRAVVFFAAVFRTGAFFAGVFFVADFLVPAFPVAVLLAAAFFAAGFADDLRAAGFFVARLRAAEVAAARLAADLRAAGFAAFFAVFFVLALAPVRRADFAGRDGDMAGSWWDVSATQSWRR